MRPRARRAKESQLRRHPEWLIAAFATLAVFRPRRVFVWVRRGFVAWRSWRWISRAARDLVLR